MGTNEGCLYMEYREYMGKAEFEKSLNTLKGIIQGIQADQLITHAEVEELQNWCLLQNDHRFKYPFKEIIPMIHTSIEDGVLTTDEIDDILWTCKMYLNDNPYFDAITADIQVLHGILHGILSDNRIEVSELNYLKDWLDSNYHLETVYPYDEVYSLLHKVLNDGKIDEEEELILKAFFSEFIDTSKSYNINQGDFTEIKKVMNINGLCALAPNIEINDNLFCFTGESSKMKRSEIEKIIIENGGSFNKNVVSKTNYLIVGDNGNPCWAFSCYGRKVEKAMELRKQGKQILIIHEIDFWDALA